MWIKVCGLRDVNTAIAASEIGVDAIGLNFFTKSVRSVEPAEAREIAKAIPRTVDVVGLFVNHTLDEIVERVEQVELGVLQLHGDETPEFLAQLQQRLPVCRLLRAFRIGAEGCRDIAPYLAECQRLGVHLQGCLVDARVDGAYGGTGHTAPWNLLAEQYDTKQWPPLILAGGLTPDNITKAIQTTHPFGVDVASGVESAPGIKSLDLIRKLVQAVRRPLNSGEVRTVELT